MTKELKNMDYSDGQVALNNSVIRSAHNLTLPEKRIISVAITLRNNTRKDGFIRINVADYAETFDLNIDNAYRQCKEAITSIRNKWVLFSDKHPNDKKLHEGGGFAWCIAYKYHDGEGTIDIALNPYLMPYIKGLGGEFTAYNLSCATGFRSVYTWRLYEMLKQFKKTGICLISLESFRFAMQYPDYYTKDFNRLRTKVINPAMKELEDKTGITIFFKTTRKGRKINMLQFKFEENPQKEFEF